MTLNEDWTKTNGEYALEIDEGELIPKLNKCLQ